MEEGAEKHVRIMIEGKRITHVGYRLMIARLASKYRLKMFSVDNIDDRALEVLVGDEEKKLNSFYETLKRNMPKYAKGTHVGEQQTYNEHDIPSLDEYMKYDFPMLHAGTTLEIVNTGIGLQRTSAKGFKSLGTKLDTLADILKRRR